MTKTSKEALKRILYTKELYLPSEATQNTYQSNGIETKYLC